MKKNDKNVFQSLIAGGIIGAGLGALISKNKKKGATIGALAGAVILATYKANQQSLKTMLPVYIEEDNKLYEIQEGKNKRFIKDIPKPNMKPLKFFILK